MRLRDRQGLDNFCRPHPGEVDCGQLRVVLQVAALNELMPARRQSFSVPDMVYTMLAKHQIETVRHWNAGNRLARVQER